MAWDARTTYYYLVCFVTLLMVIFGTVRVVQHGLDLLLPEEPYRPSPVELRERTPRPPGQADTTFTREELEEMAEEEAARQRRQQQRRTLRGLLGSLVLVLIAAPVYWYHWRRVRRDE